MKRNDSYDQYRNSNRSSAIESLFDLVRAGHTQHILEIVGEDATLLKRQDARGYSLLMMASYHGQIEITEKLLDLGANPNSGDNGGGTPLMGAAFKGYLEIVELLLLAGANAEIKNHSGQTALQFAEMFGRKNVSDLLRQVQHKQSFPLARGLQSWLKYFKQKILNLLRRKVQLNEEIA